MAIIHNYHQDHSILDVVTKHVQIENLSKEDKYKIDLEKERDRLVSRKAIECGAARFHAVSISRLLRSCLRL